MSASKLPQYVLQELPDITEIINSPLKSTQRIKYTCFDVSKSLIAFGATSGGIYVFNRHPCEFVQLIPNKDGAITRLSISRDERHIGFANGRGLVTVTACEQDGAVRTVTSKEHQGNEVTAMAWGQHALFTGDDTGRVAVLALPTLITKAIFNPGPQTIMSLDSRICQLDMVECLLVASTMTKSYICDTRLERFRQVGYKPRDGNCGACFFSMDKANDNDNNEISDQVYKETRQYDKVDTDHCFTTSEKLKKTVIFCARPSLRLWEASIEGTVLRTHQFKQVLSRQPQKIITYNDFDNEKLTIQSFSKNAEPKSCSFNRLHSVKSSAIFTYKKNALYFLNIQNVDQTMWFEFNDIVDCRILNDLIYVWLTNGSLVSLKYMKIDKYIVKCYVEGKYGLCAEICALYKDYLLTNTLSAKITIVSGLRDKIHEDRLNSIKEVLSKIDDLKENDASNMKSGIVVVENSYHSQTEISDDESNATSIDDNIFPTLKELSSTVTDTINTSKKLLKEKWEGLEDKMKLFSDTKVQSFETDIPRRIQDDNVATDIKVEFENEIIYKESSLTPVAVVDDEAKETDKICKSLYQQYILNAIGEGETKSNVKEIVDIYSCDIKEVYKLMLSLGEYCLSINALEDSKHAPSNIFLSYLNDSDRELLDDIIKDEVLYKFFVESCILVNRRSQKISNIGCECGYPLPFTKTNQTPEYSEIIDDFIERQWSSQTRDQCYEICKSMPYLWRKILYLRRNEDLVNLLMMLLQILDENLLHSFLPQFTIETWERTVQLYAILQTNICLNCQRKFDHISVRNTLSWDDLAALIIKSVGGKNAIKIMEKNADLIQIGELTMKFYHTCLIVAAYEKYDGTITSALVDTLYSCYDVGEARVEICKLLRTIQNGEIKNTALPVIVAANSTHWGMKIIKSDPEINSETKEQTYREDNESELIRKCIGMADISEFLINVDCSLCGLPLSNEVLIQDGGLWCFCCGHVFHGACLDLNKVKLCPSCIGKT